MTIYTIANESNNVIAHLSEQDADVVTGAERFSSEEELANLAQSWPTARLVAIFNNLPGVTPVKKFTDRKTAINRIWNVVSAIENAASPAIEESDVAEVAPQTDAIPEPEPTPEAEPTTAPEAAQGPDVAPADAPSLQKTTRAKKTPTANGSREGSKMATVLDLMKREGVVTAKELMSVTGWQAHSVRGFISGTLGKKMGLTVISTKGENGERTYTIQG